MFIVSKARRFAVSAFVLFAILLPSMALAQLIPGLPIGPLPGATAEPHLTLQVGFTGFSGTDFQGTLDVTPGQVSNLFNIRSQCCTYTGEGEIGPHIFFDSIFVDVLATVKVGGLGFVTPISGDATHLQLMTVYGVDVSPTTALTSMTGFIPAAPQLVPVTTETFTGQARGIPVSYPAASTNAMRVSDMLPLLPGIQTIFNGADPNSIVYVSTAMVPTADFLTLP